jgi:hypothetical protein
MKEKLLADENEIPLIYGGIIIVQLLNEPSDFHKKE